jgi:phosphate transport system substrate-binding protein
LSHYIRPVLAVLLGLVCLPFAAARAQETMVLRDRLVIASSSTAARVAEQLSRVFAEQYGGAVPPDLRTVGSNQALWLFCSGLGPDTPDMAVTTRRMSGSVRDACRTNGVRDVVELRLGLAAVVLAARRGDPMPQLTSRLVQEAVAAERVSADGDFVPNTITTWAQLSRSLPATQIRLLVPTAGSGLRQTFEDLVLEAGCRGIREVQLLFEAAFRRGKCVSLRSDGRIIEVAAADASATLLASPPGTLAIMSLDEVVRSGGNIVALPLDGVLPTFASIANLDYDQTRVVYLYAKRQHARNQRGVGVVNGIAEMLATATSESAIGPAGFLSVAGLVPLPPADRLAQRRAAERMSTISLN